MQIDGTRAVPFLHYFRPWLVVLPLTIWLAAPAGGVIVSGTQGRNLSEPTGRLAGSGWQFHGEWASNFLGIAIGPRHFITAKHVGGYVGDPFLFHGKKYYTINKEPLPDCDLTVWTVDRELPQYAPLYTGRSEVGMEIVFFGRGQSNGDPVVVEGRRRGWKWGEKDGKWSWGTNRIDGILAAGGEGVLQAGEKIVFDFSENAGPNEGAVAPGDSGAGVFLQDGGQWKLAGINYGVTGGYSLSGGEQDSFSGAIFDGRGLWRSTGVGYAYNGEVDLYAAPTVSFATRISTYSPRIRAILDAPPRQQIFTRRRATIVAGLLFLAALGAYVVRVRPLLRRLRERYQRHLPVK